MRPTSAEQTETIPAIAFKILTIKNKIIKLKTPEWVWEPIQARLTKRSYIAGHIANVNNHLINNQAKENRLRLKPGVVGVNPSPVLCVIHQIGVEGS